MMLLTFPPSNDMSLYPTCLEQARDGPAAEQAAGVAPVQRASIRALCQPARQLTIFAVFAILTRNHLRLAVFYCARPTGACEVIQVQDMIDEEALVQEAKTDPEAFGHLYERYVDKIYNYVYYRTGNHHDAEDLTAKVFCQALNHIARYVQRGAPFSSWLYRIAHNLVANWHRDRSRRNIVSLDVLAVVGQRGQDGPFQQAAWSEQRESLLAAIRQLPDDRQELLILKFVEHLPNAEIGQIMGRSEGAIKSLYHRTLISLRQELGERMS
jgi:RNA polymerase sigma-70 factor (ECF subfamily)